METAIITLRTPDGLFEQDMELPTNLTVGDLTGKLLETLRLLDWQRFGCITDPDLVWNGQVLDRRKTLDALGIWDGEIIVIR